MGPAPRGEGMSDLEKLKEILDNQAERGIRTDGLERCDYEIEELYGRLRLAINSREIAFVFTRNGRFMGIYNLRP